MGIDDLLEIFQSYLGIYIQEEEQLVQLVVLFVQLLMLLVQLVMLLGYILLVLF